MTRSLPADEGTQVYTGSTVDLALRAARAAHGAQVEVVRAVKVVAGVRGLLGQARYSVVVRPRPARPAPTTTVTVLAHPQQATPAEDPVRSALDELLDAAEERERVEAALADDGSGWSWTQQQEVDRLLDDLGARLGPDTPRHPALAVAEHRDAGPHDGPDADDGHGLDLLTVGPGGSELLGTGWDRAELRRLGVPAPVLSRLPVEDPSDDAGWRRALLTAIAATVPAPGLPDAQHPVVISGHGLLGAVAVLRACLEDGATPGTITLEGRSRPATPAALVDVLAACARS